MRSRKVALFCNPAGIRGQQGATFFGAGESRVHS